MKLERLKDKHIKKGADIYGTWNAGRTIDLHELDHSSARFLLEKELANAKYIISGPVLVFILFSTYLIT